MHAKTAERKANRRPPASRSVQVTADALVVLRADRALAVSFGVVDPYARYFVTAAGKGLADLAGALDPCFVPFNLARYRYFTERLRQAAAQYRQVVLLGVGYDTRALSLSELARGRVEVFEVDFPDKLASKHAVLARAGVAVPSYVRSVPTDLSGPGLREHLCRRGFKSFEPTLVLMEGVVFFLPPAATRQLLAPETLALAPGSAVLFDYWSNERIERLNQRVAATLGHRLFQAFPFPDGPAALKRSLAGLGYQDLRIADLDSIVATIQRGNQEPAYRGSWFVASAAVV